MRLKWLKYKCPKRYVDLPSYARAAFEILL